MEIVISVILLLGATVIANIIHPLLPQIPLAFYQIGAGFLVSWLPQFNKFHLAPEVFLLVIIAPLMFNEGQNTSHVSLQRHFKSIISLAVVLTVATVLVIGFFLHSIWPIIALPLAFCLAAIITPTDSVAVSSITANFEISQSIREKIENESLFNDAAGIVVLDLALTAFMTGKFSLIRGIANFIVVFGGGIVCGIILGSLCGALQLFFQQHSPNSAATISSINLLTPFLVYLSAEELNFSGILAVVSAGIIQGVYKKRLRLTSTSNQVVLSSMWEILSQLLNGFTFVLLGISLPRNMIELANSDSLNPGTLLFLALIIYILMTLLRFIWVQFGKPLKRNNLKNSAVIALCGIHGTITLAMAFSLPITFRNQPFPLRTNLIFLAETIIILSLIVPTFLLPLFLPHKKNSFNEQQFNGLLAQMIDYAIQELKEQKKIDPLTLSQVISILHTQRGPNDHNTIKKVSKLFQRCLGLEIKVIRYYAHKQLIQQNFAEYYNAKQLLRLHKVILTPKMRLKLDWKIFSNVYVNQNIWRTAHLIKKNPTEYRNQAKLMEKWGYQAVLKYLKQDKISDPKCLKILRRYYEIRHQRINKTPEKNTNEQEVLISAFQYEYSYLQMIAKEQICSAELIHALSEKISTDQFVYITSDD
ncbi:cation:proton antiporter [Xylocopilactobacillus apicola]|uniref:Na+/H+ antiporter n=1 Tax=Xylocopilactobacillus apicola TaxID=2932184 RepID=A0AAU9DUA7_9LACO|nr:sodium:proton antiporter [Xylocopilactobacillus apicola]BDR59063.1 Na+/H+ antiporter [Xylocopilactobacillus apicola]